MAEATIKPARIFPKKSINTKITINAPSIKLVSTVPMARFTNPVRSTKGSISISAGKDFLIVSILAFTLATTSALLAPFNIITIPPTASRCPLYVNAP